MESFREWGLLQEHLLSLLMARPNDVTIGIAPDARSSLLDPQPLAASDTEQISVPSPGLVLLLAAALRRDRRVDHATAGRARSYRRISPPVIEVRAPINFHLSHWPLFLASMVFSLPLYYGVLTLRLR